VKLDMGRFTAQYTPAFAGSFPITAAGYTPYDVGVGDGQIVCILGNATNVQVQHTVSTYGTAQMWSGLITFGVDEPKNVENVSVRFDALTTGTSVKVDIYDKAGGTLLATQTEGTVGETELVLDDFTEVLREGYELKLTAVGQVTIRRWTTRAVPAPRDIPEEIILPLIMAREVRVDDKTVCTMDPLAVWDHLKELMRTRSKVRLKFGNELIDVRVDQVGFEGSMNKWDERGRWPEGIVLVRLVSVL
jgi:hypothetical protein